MMYDLHQQLYAAEELVQGRVILLQSAAANINKLAVTVVAVSKQNPGSYPCVASLLQ